MLYVELYVQEYLKGSKQQPGPEHSKVGLLFLSPGRHITYQANICQPWPAFLILGRHSKSPGRSTQVGRRLWLPGRHTRELGRSQWPIRPALLGRPCCPGWAGIGSGGRPASPFDRSQALVPSIQEGSSSLSAASRSRRDRAFVSATTLFVKYRDQHTTAYAALDAPWIPIPEDQDHMATVSWYQR
jgi:hypothetical protein